MKRIKKLFGLSKQKPSMSYPLCDRLHINDGSVTVFLHKEDKMLMFNHTVIKLTEGIDSITIYEKTIHNIRIFEQVLSAEDIKFYLDRDNDLYPTDMDQWQPKRVMT